MNKLEEQQLNDTVLRILRECPVYMENSCESLDSWIANIGFHLEFNPRHHPQLKCRLMWIWLSQCKGLIIPNLEN